jgi:hypothetical protein
MLISDISSTTCKTTDYSPMSSTSGNSHHLNTRRNGYAAITGYSGIGSGICSAPDAMVIPQRLDLLQFNSAIPSTTDVKVIKR